MRIKKYVARDMQEAVALIKHDLGSEAVIISSRRVRGRGLFGFLTPQLEVTAALDKQQADGTPPVQSPAAGAEPKAKEELRPASIPGNGEAAAAEQKGLLHRELSEVKTLLYRLSDYKQAKDEDLFLLQWRRFLTGMEIEEELVNELLTALEKEVPPDHPHRAQAAEVFLLKRIAQLVEPAYADGGTAQVIVFVGPTGVGKTTTLAKLAAQFHLFYQKEVVLVTIDTYRIGAVEQLKTYAEIIGVPLEVVNTPVELRQALHNHAAADHILIDTAGRPSRNLQQVLELRGFIEVIPTPCDIYLVLSCNTKYRDLLRVAGDFGRLHFNKLIFTKLDETETFGAILNLVYHLGLPATYVTNGQSVPDDIETLYPKRLAKMLLKGGEHGAGPSAQVANPH